MANNQCSYHKKLIQSITHRFMNQLFNNWKVLTELLKDQWNLNYLQHAWHFYKSSTTTFSVNWNSICLTVGVAMRDKEDREAPMHNGQKMCIKLMKTLYGSVKVNCPYVVIEPMQIAPELRNCNNITDTQMLLWQGALPLSLIVGSKMLPSRPL